MGKKDLPPDTPYEAGMLFCQIIATMVAAKHPKVATVERMVRRRKDGTIYVDYLQNIQGKTLACAYSARGSAEEPAMLSRQSRSAPSTSILQ